jgi:hypothetical protein
VDPVKQSRHQRAMLRLTNNSDNRVEAYLNKVEMDEKMFQSKSLPQSQTLVNS